MANLYKVKGSNSLWVKQEASATSDNTGTLAVGSEITVDKITDGWYHFATGWVYGSDGFGSSVLTDEGEITTTDVPASTANTATTGASAATTTTTATIDNYPTYAGGDITTIQANYQSILSGLRIKTLRGVFGMPYQYMPIADTRIDSGTGSFGRKYADKIVARMPLLLMTPGTPEFLSGYSATEKQGVIESTLSMFGDNSTKSDLDSLLTKSGRYYALKFNWVDYYNHVNPMCRAAARFMNIQNTQLDGVTLDEYNWSKNNNDEIHKYLNYKGSLAFYINSENQISDSFSNATAESQLASKVNQMSEMGRELNFLLGGAGALTGIEYDKYTKQEGLDKNLQNSKDMSAKILNGNNLISSITGGLQTVFAGGKLIFPEIWSDSQFSRGYEVNIKLTSPDQDAFSLYLNIIVPILHLVGLCAPRQAGPNGFISPFLVRAYYKGLFNCDMGIITNMSINKGAEGSWNKDGIPTVVDVSFTIKDLYSAMAISNNKNISTGNGLLSNIALMDYIANMCGVNVNEPDIQRTISMYYMQYGVNKVADTFKLDIAGGLDQWSTNKMLNIWKRF